jgi:hypothetical protein
MPTPAVIALGLMAMDSSAGFVTVNAVDPDVAPDVAVMVVLPTARALATPEVALTVATA